MNTLLVIAANLIASVHLLYAGFIVAALLLILIGMTRGWEWIRNPWFRLIHLTMILIVVVEAWLGIKCPLTVWEHDLRQAAGQPTTDGDFIATHVHSVLFFDLPPWAFTLIYTLVGGTIVLTWLLAPPRGKPRRKIPA